MSDEYTLEREIDALDSEILRLEDALAKVTRERDEARATVERVRALADRWWSWAQQNERIIVRELRAALDGADQ